MVTVEYAIPSRARAETLVAKTLPLLHRLGIPPERIRVFISAEDFGDYADLVAPFGARLREGALGMRAQRHAILDAYPPGARVVSVDDDIADLLVRAGEKTLVPIEPDEWAALVDDAYALCGTTGSILWGLYPVPNPYFMRPRWRTDLSYVGGGLFGVINDPSPDSPLRVTLDDKEDFERSLACYSATGAVVRCDFVTWKTVGYRGAGGMQADGLRTPERIEESARILAARYPALATVNTTKKSGKTELRLNDRRVPA